MNENKAVEKGSENGSSGMHPVLFDKNRYFEFLYRKSEKISTALYLITNFIKDTDLIKTRIREKALDMLSTNLSLNTAALSDRKFIFKKYEALITELSSLVFVAFHAGLVSEMNFSVIRTELEKLLADVRGDEYEKGRQETVFLSPAFFDIGQAGNWQAKSDPLPDAGKGFGSSSDDAYKRQAHPQNQPVSRFSVKDRSREASRGAAGESGAMKKNDRPEIILGLLKKKQGLGIKDFVGSIKDCSEKTIQRELIAMVEAGAIRKEGERRWSRYYLNS